MRIFIYGLYGGLSIGGKQIRSLRLAHDTTVIAILQEFAEITEQVEKESYRFETEIYWTNPQLMFSNNERNISQMLAQLHDLKEYISSCTWVSYWCH